MEEKLQKLMQLEKERNSLLAEISASLRVIANKENQSEVVSKVEDAKNHRENTGKSAFGT